MTAAPPELPPPIAHLLRWAWERERRTGGLRRRNACRLTRQVIGGIVEAGYPSRAVADCLGLTTRTVLDRIEHDGWLPASVVEEATGIGPPGWLALATRQSGKEPSRYDTQSDSSYPAVEVIRALAEISDLLS